MPGRRWPGQYYFASDSAALLVGEVILVYSVALAVLQVRGAAGCVYHCAQSPCGPLRLGVTPFFVGFPFGDVDADGIPQSLGGSYQNVYTVDLSGLNISKILPGAFTDCFTFNETTAVQGIDLRNNPLGAIPDPAVFGSIGFLSLRNCSIGGITATELAGFHGRAVKFTSTFSGLVYSNFTQMYLDLSDNPITALPPMLFSESTVNQMVLSMSNHQLTALPPELFAGSAAERLYVSLSSGNISQLPSAPLSGFAGSSLLIDLSSNALDVLPGAILTQFHGFNLGLSVDNNRLKSLPAALFGNHTAISGIRLMSLAFNATANQISSVGPMFDDSFNPGFGTTILLSSNYISTNGLIAIVSSYTHAEGQLALYLDDNQVSDVPANLYDGVGAGVAPPVSVKITLKGNPLRKFSPSVFGGLAYLASTVLDVSFPTIPGLEIPTPIDFSSGVSFRPPATLRIRIAGTGVALSTAAAFSGFLAVPQNCNHSRGLLASRCTGCGPSCILTLDLSYNNITSAASGSLANAALTKLNLSNNGLRDFATDAFNNSRSLRELVLSYNALTVIPLEQRSNTPQLVRLAIDHNVIQAMPLAVNGIARPADAAANILTCVEYLPTATGCTCAAGFYLSELCGYVRCTAQPYGCRPPTLFNGTSCARSPWSTCVDPAITYGEAFYIEALHVFKPLSQCENQFAGSGGHSTPATYLVANYTTTSDRLCSICSVCPPSYKTTPCTATSDTVCDHEPYVAPEDWGTLVAFTVMCIVGCTLLAAITMKYRSKMRDLKDRLDSTRKTICTVREDRRRMDQAWAIKQTDLIFEREIGAGACGRVYEGKWGITPVAIKVLMTPMDTEMAREEFEREVDFMKWVRHPNLITFLGAGVGNFQSLGLCAFLVTELIEKGSLQEVLDDPSVVLVWPNRVQLAADIASALWYLHFIGSVHRDLKPDNCLVTHDMRAKVSDFGTSRVTNLDILDHFKRRGTLVQNLRSWSNISASSSVDDVMPSPSVNLTRHVGTLLWMAPEVLTDSVKIDQAWALDVYSFALVMYEMWSGVQPWSDLKCHPGEVFEELMNRVPHGERPRLPDARAPPDYAELVVQCWDPVAAKRPRFEEIVAVLRQLVARYRHYSLLPKEFGRGLGAEPGPIPPARAVIKLPQADQADPVIARSETVDHAGVQRSVKSAFVKRVFSRLRGVDHHPSCSNDESISAETPLLPKRLEHRHKSKSPHHAFADHNGDTNIDNDMISDHAHPSETMEQMTGTRTRRRRPIYEGDGEAPFQCNPAYEEHCGY